MKTSTFYTSYAYGHDNYDRTHQVTVVGVRKEIKNDCLMNLTTNMDKNGHGTFCCEVAPETTFIFDVAYAISNPDDPLDPEMGERIAKRRLKKNEFKTIKLDSDKIIPAPICQAIVEAEAKRIAAKVDSYIAKLQRI